MIKRLSVVSTITDALGKRANISTPYVFIAELTPNRWLIKQTLPDGTATTPGWLIDVTVDADGNQTDIDIGTLTSDQLTTVKTWLTNQSIDATGLTYTIVKNRRDLLVWLLKRIAWWLGWDAGEMKRLLLHGYDVAG